MGKTSIRMCCWKKVVAVEGIGPKDRGPPQAEPRDGVHGRALAEAAVEDAGDVDAA